MFHLLFFLMHSNFVHFTEKSNIWMNIDKCLMLLSTAIIIQWREFALQFKSICFCCKIQYTKLLSVSFKSLESLVYKNIEVVLQCEYRRCSLGETCVYFTIGNAANILQRKYWWIYSARICNFNLTNLFRKQIQVMYEINKKKCRTFVFICKTLTVQTFNIKAFYGSQIFFIMVDYTGMMDRGS